MYANFIYAKPTYIKYTINLILMNVQNTIVLKALDAATSLLDHMSCYAICCLTFSIGEMFTFEQPHVVYMQFSSWAHLNASIPTMRRAD